ncbi:MAG: MFS transporter [archaeon]|nr:MFS transporter [archaeon]
MFAFGIPGAFIGTFIFSKISDKYGSRNLKNRVTLIIIALSTAFIAVFGLFFIPLPELTLEQGKNMSIIIQYPIFLILGVIVFFSGFIMAIFAVNQPPIIQEINLPEAQGTIASWNQLVEVVGYGSGPIIGGYFLQTLNNDYLGAVGRVIFLGIPGVLMWVITYWTINKDKNRIKTILEQRAEELAGFTEQKAVIE